MTLLPAHVAQKAALLDELGRLADLAGAIGMTTLQVELVSTRIPKLVSERFHLVVLGEFNHGKSTFVNALLGAEVLPTGITPTTATINHVVFAHAPTARAMLEDGREVSLAVDALSDWVTVEGSHAREARFVEVGFPAEILRDQVTLVDTPGVNDLNEQRAEVTYGYVPRADAVIFLLDAGQALKESERAFLASRILERSRDRMIFVLGKMDLVHGAEADIVTAYVEKHLARLCGRATMFPVSAKLHLAGDRERSGMGPLVEHLGFTLTAERGRILLDNAAADALRAAAYLSQSLGMKRQSLTLSVSELETRVARVRQELQATRESLAGLHERIDAEAAAVQARLRLDLEDFVARFLTVLPSQIDAASAGDVQRFLSPFLQDKLKEWAEREGETLAGLLERLAEEVIAVTNESTRLATAALADRLGPADARVHLEVDSFKYDVSIFAVGALGTTIFLFVNTLVGGLLTLAAPILAVLLSSKVTADIREHAKEQAAVAIRRAQAAIVPHFEQIVEDFAARLHDFVTTAGDKLYRGIGEVLDRAIAERRERQGAVAPLAAEIDAQAVQLDELRGRLEHLRASLWSAPAGAAPAGPDPDAPRPHPLWGSA